MAPATDARGLVGNRPWKRLPIHSGRFISPEPRTSQDRFDQRSATSGYLADSYRCCVWHSPQIGLVLRGQGAVIHRAAQHSLCSFQFKLCLFWPWASVRTGTMCRNQGSCPQTCNHYKPAGPRPWTRPADQQHGRDCCSSCVITGRSREANSVETYCFDARIYEPPHARPRNRTASRKLPVAKQELNRLSAIPDLRVTSRSKSEVFPVREFLAEKDGGEPADGSDPVGLR